MQAVYQETSWEMLGQIILPKYWPEEPWKYTVHNVTVHKILLCMSLDMSGFSQHQLLDPYGEISRDIQAFISKIGLKHQSTEGCSKRLAHAEQMNNLNSETSKHKHNFWTFLKSHL